MKTIRPVPNINGESRENLIAALCEARQELLAAAQAMPHPRDYQTGGDYGHDRQEAERRIAEVQDLAELYYQDAIALVREGESPSPRWKA